MRSVTQAVAQFKFNLKQALDRGYNNDSVWQRSLELAAGILQAAGILFAVLAGLLAIILWPYVSITLILGLALARIIYAGVRGR